MQIQRNVSISAETISKNENRNPCSFVERGNLTTLECGFYNVAYYMSNYVSPLHIHDSFIIVILAVRRA